MERPSTADLAEVPLPELLTLISDLFGDPPVELFGTPSLGDRGASGERTRRLRVALGELSDRAAKLCHPARSACLCGEAFGTPDELDQHFYDVFLPDDDIGVDGRPHAEIITEPPALRTAQ